MLDFKRGTPVIIHHGITFLMPIYKLSAAHSITTVLILINNFYSSEIS